MGLETATHIADLVNTNPTSSDDPSQGDDHIRMIKSVLLTDFANIDGAVTATDSDLNLLTGAAAAGVTSTEVQYLDGVTSAIQTQIDGKQASNANLTDVAAITQTKGDLIVSNGTDLVGLAVGTNGQVLVADSTQAKGVKWDAAGIFTESFESSEQSITSAGSLTLAHSLSSQPKLYGAFLKCNTSEGNYSVGDEVPLSGNAFNSTNQGIVLIPDATNMNVRFGALSTTFNLLDKTAGTVFSATNANWRLIVRAWA